jgi:hypothetical protein
MVGNCAGWMRRNPKNQSELKFEKDVKVLNKKLMG